MTGRLGIDDVTPRSGDGRHPSKAVVGEVDPDRRHRLARGPRRRRRERRVDEGRQPTAPGQHVRMAPTRAERRPLRPPPSSPTSRACGRSGSTRGATRGPPGDTPSPSSSTPGRARTSWRTTSRSAPGCCSAWAAGPPSARTATCCSARPTRCATPRCRCTPASRPRCSRPSHTIMVERPVRELITRGQPRAGLRRPRRARCSAPGTSSSRAPPAAATRHGRPVHGTFATAAKELDRVAAMGFDVVYLPPIHPIGTVHRKGPQQRRVRRPGAAGRRRLAVGDRLGRGRPRRDPPRAGHVRRLRRLRRARPATSAWRSRSTSRCSAAPDHPWVKEHPEWFTVRPDGTIAYAENPPKKYQDIYPVNFDNDPEGIYAEALRVRAALGRARRADLPGGQPAHQAAELLALADLAGQGRVPGRAVPRRGVHPARRGCSGWPGSASPRATRTSPGAPSKEELTEFALMHAERARRVPAELLRQHPGHPARVAADTAGPAMFAIRAALAATMAPDLGRLLGLRAVRGRGRASPGSEEYLNSEKYELRPRDFAAAAEPAAARWSPTSPGSTRSAARTRRCSSCATSHFHHVDNDQIIAYSKTDPATGDTVLVVMHPRPAQRAGGQHSRSTCPRSGSTGATRFTVHDEITGGDLPLGPVQLRAAGALAPRGAHLPRRPFRAVHLPAT